MQRRTWWYWLLGGAGVGGLMLLFAGLLYSQDQQLIAQAIIAVVMGLCPIVVVASMLSYGIEGPAWKAWWIKYVWLYVGKVLLAAPLVYFDAPGSGAVVLILGAALELWLLMLALKEHRNAQMLALCLIGSLNVLLAARLLFELQSDDLAIMILGAAAMTLTFMGLLWVIRQVLWLGSPICGIARTLIDEAIRMKIAMVFVVLMIVMLAWLPGAVDADRFDYQMHRFLIYSLMATTFLLGVMTIFLACATITREFEQQQIFLTLTKPVGRLQYLLGKLLGIVLLNLILVSVAGINIYAFTRVLQAQHPDSRERQIVLNEVLVGRAAIQPSPADPGMLDRLRDQRLEQMRRDQPHLYDELDARQIREIEGAVLSDWLTIAPQNRRTYIFSGLDVVRERGGILQLRMKPRRTQTPETGDDDVYLAIFVNGRRVLVPDLRFPERPFIPQLKIKHNTFRVIDLPSEYIDDDDGRIALIDDDGRIAMEVVNLSVAGPEGFGSVSFTPGSDFEMLYPVASFEANLARGLLVLWIQLALLAAIGLAAGSLLSFPVACLLSFMVYITGIAKDYITEAIGYYVALPRDELGWWMWLREVVTRFFGSLSSGEFEQSWKLIVALLGRIVIAVLPSISDFDIAEPIASGRVVPMNLVGEAALWMGLIWGVLMVLVGWWILKRREIARVIV